MGRRRKLLGGPILFSNRAVALMLSRLRSGPNATGYFALNAVTDWNRGMGVQRS